MDHSSCRYLARGRNAGIRECTELIDSGKHRNAIGANGTTIRSIQVIDIEDLQSDVRSKVDALLADIKPDELESLRHLIDETPEALSALKAKGRVTRRLWLSMSIKTAF